MRNERFDDAVSAILSTDTRYPREAYTLITAALDYTIRGIHADRRAQDDDGPHVSGQQLAEGLRDYMLSVNINSTDDIGELVYNLIEVGAFGKTDSDKKSDFHAVYDFEETFVLPFRCEHD